MSNVAGAVRHVRRVTRTVKATMSELVCCRPSSFGVRSSVNGREWAVVSKP